MRLFFPLVLSACTVDYAIATKNPPIDEPPAEPPIEAPIEEPVVEPEIEEPPVEPEVPEDVWDEPTPQALHPMYAHTRDSLFEIDAAGGTPNLIGQFTLSGAPLDGIVDVAIDPDGRLYAGDRGPGVGGPYSLYRVDPTTAAATLICTITHEMTALTFTSAGLLVAGGAAGLVTVDMAAGCAMGSLFQDDDMITSGDVVGLPDGLLYWTVRGEDGDRLIVVDPVTRLSGERGEIDFDRLFGLGYDDVEGRLFGFSADGEMVEIDPSNASSSLVTEDEEHPWWGATTNPVAWGTP